MLFLFYVLYLSIITCIINARRLHHLVLEYHKICLDLLLFRVLFQFFPGIQTEPPFLQLIILISISRAVCT